MSTSSSSSDSRSINAPIMGKKVRSALNDQITSAQNALGQSFVGPDGLVAGTNENILAGQNALLGAAGQQGALGQAGAEALQGFLRGDSPILQRRLQQIANMGTRNLQENILPGIRTGSVQAGQAGSSRQGIAEGIAARGASEAVTNAQTDLLANAEQQRQAALGQIGALQQNLAQPGLTMGAVGAQQRDIQQQLMQEGLLRQQAELQRLGGMGNIVSQAALPQIGSYGNSSSSSSSSSMDLNQAAGAASGALMAMFSDKRLKDSIEYVGENKGVPWYRWVWNKEANALGLYGSSEGVLADDVQKSHPEAVVHNHQGSGYMAVNYSMLGV